MLKHFLSSYKKPLSFIILLLIIVCTGVFFFYQFKPVVETPRNEMKHIPSDVKNALDKQLSVTKIPEEEKIASISGTIRVPILLYHYVEVIPASSTDKMRKSLNIPPAIFEQQMSALKNAGYTFMTAKDLGNVLDGIIQLPPNPILITFDDGHWDVDTVILPILKKYQIRATAYIIPGFTGKSDFMTEQQVQDVVNSGLVDIGAHTVHHISLKGKLLPVVQYEVEQSKNMLEQTYHIHVVSFAYPNGSFDEQAIHVVQNAGFTTSVSTIAGIMQNQQNRFFLYRLRPGYRTGQVLLDYLQQTSFKVY